jgi:hypothetical protein
MAVNSRLIMTIQKYLWRVGLVPRGHDLRAGLVDADVADDVGHVPAVTPGAYRRSAEGGGSRVAKFLRLVELW